MKKLHLNNCHLIQKEICIASPNPLTPSKMHLVWKKWIIITMITSYTFTHTLVQLFYVIVCEEEKKKKNVNPLKNDWQLVTICQVIQIWQNAWSKNNYKEIWSTISKNMYPFTQYSFLSVGSTNLIFKTFDFKS